jgi:hypothetical protein
MIKLGVKSQVLDQLGTLVACISFLFCRLDAVPLSFHGDTRRIAIEVEKEKDTSSGTNRGTRAENRIGSLSLDSIRAVTIGICD